MLGADTGTLWTEVVQGQHTLLATVVAHQGLLVRALDSKVARPLADAAGPVTALGAVGTDVATDTVSRGTACWWDTCTTYPGWPQPKQLSLRSWSPAWASEAKPLGHPSEVWL